HGNGNAVDGTGLTDGVEDTNFGNYLAAQHAVAAGDFRSAGTFMEAIRIEPCKKQRGACGADIVSGLKNLVLFLDGGKISDISAPVSSLSAQRIIRAAANAKIGRWKDVFAEFKNDRSQLWSPMRIWSAAGAGRTRQAIRFIDSMPAGKAWKDFAKGAVYAAAKKNAKAARLFQSVPIGFLNIGDYNLLLAFYKRHGFKDYAAALRQKWTSSVGGMFMAAIADESDWRDYDSHQKMLAAFLMQTVAHNFDAVAPDAVLLALRAAAYLGAAPANTAYYTGGYFFAAGSENYKKYWDGLETDPIYGPFVLLKTGGEGGLKRILAANPLFMPAIISLWKSDMQAGRESSALRMLDRALEQSGVPEAGRAYLLKMRAHTLYIFKEYEAAEKDAAAALNLAPMDAGIMDVLAKIWAAGGKNLDEAYRYSISLIRAFPSHIGYWDALAMSVRAKEGDLAAREILERVGKVAEENSELFMHLGDLRAAAGEKIGASAAYKKALALSGDGLVVKSEIEKKLRRLK
ncbi:MAG: hypothetical protein LBB08_02440, partial [Rickettsiales bacterium]|nr:hypothetical protein [Rickettsiales bacterium]